MMQSKAIVLKLHGGSSDDTSSWEKKKREKKFDQNVKTKKKHLLASLIKTRCFQFRNYFSVSSILFFLLLTNDFSL